MAKVYISVLGTTDYKPCTYCFPDDASDYPGIRFVQEATFSHHCREWTENDRALILVTDDSYKKNWLDDGHVDRDGNLISREGLKKRLSQLQLRPKIEYIPITDGKNEEEIWQNFWTIYNLLLPDDEVVFDITHSFRSLPVLVLVALIYARVLKDVSLLSIDYGAFEAAPEVDGVKKAPVFDLSPFVDALDWAQAIHVFLKSGNASFAAELALRKAKVAKALVRKKAPEIDSMNAVAKNMDQFSKDIATCRGLNLRTNALNLSATLARAMDSGFLPQIKPLLERLNAQVVGYGKNEVHDGLAAAQWCLDHNLIQQGFTILQESIKSHYCDLIGLDENRIDMREAVKSGIYAFRKNLPRDRWEVAPQNKEIIHKLIVVLNGHPNSKSMAESFCNLTNIRNDLNHAGFSKHKMPADDFRVALQKYIDDFKRIFVT